MEPTPPPAYRLPPFLIRGAIFAAALTLFSGVLSAIGASDGAGGSRTGGLWRALHMPAGWLFDVIGFDIPLRAIPNPLGWGVQLLSVSLVNFVLGAFLGFLLYLPYSRIPAVPKNREH